MTSSRFKVQGSIQSIISSEMQVELKKNTASFRAVLSGCCLCRQQGSSLGFGKQLLFPSCGFGQCSGKQWKAVGSYSACKYEAQPTLRASEVKSPPCQKMFVALECKLSNMGHFMVFSS